MFVLQGDALGDPRELTPYYHTARPEITPMSLQGMYTAIMATREAALIADKEAKSKVKDFQFDLL